MRQFLTVFILSTGAVCAATPGSFVGTSASGDYFNLNMDGAQSVVAETYTDDIPAYSSIGVLRTIGPKRYRVEHERVLPNNCARRTYADSAARPILLCSHAQLTPLNDVVYERVRQKGDRQIYRCRSGCSFRIPREMSYEELD